MAGAATEPKMTPMMAQWHACKQQAGEALLFFRMGDFFEAFYDDAEALAKTLDLTLTQRQGIPMAGVPQQTADSYIDRLVSRGFCVAIAEQVEDPKQTKGLVRREVVRVVTPGTVVESSLLAERANNYLVSIAQVGAIFGLSYLDLTTGEFRAAEFEERATLLDELYRLRPAELVTAAKFKEDHPHLLREAKTSLNFMHSLHDAWHFDHATASETLLGHFGVKSLDGYGLNGMTVAINAAGGLLTYVQDSLCHKVDHVTEITTYTTSNFLTLDRTTQRNLELTSSLTDGGRENTLLSVLDRSCTPMGGRMMAHWIQQPLIDVNEIRARQDAIENFVIHRTHADAIRHLLGGIRDLERLMMKVVSGFASPRDLATLRFSLEKVAPLRQELSSLDTPLLTQQLQGLSNVDDVAQTIAEALVDDPPLRLGEGRSFREGHHAELDELRSLSNNGKEWLANYQAKLREELDIKTLKVGYNRMFGYYLEVSRAQSERMPDTFQRRQTLVNAERYISPELKEYEQKIFSAEDRIASLESHLFVNLRSQIAQRHADIAKTAQALATVDCLAGLADVARLYGYCRPQVDEGDILRFYQARHPVIEAANLTEAFIPNDTRLDARQRLHIITGPNMAGKSTYIRQVALLTIMAQMGGFVPAKEAQVGVVDKVFTRIGASDDLSRGQSTFMVEMTETANILNHATSRSLVVLDEIGRGTSTYDGISIAWSVAEFLLTTSGKKAKTLFATHYHELTQLEGTVEGAVNFNVAVQEHADGITFLRKIVQGGTDRSYGVHVGKLAGLPAKVVQRARELLEDLERSGVGAKRGKLVKAVKGKKHPNSVQLSLFGGDGDRPAPPSAVELALAEVDVDTMSPIDALNRLYELKGMAKTG